MGRPEGTGDYLYAFVKYGLSFADEGFVVAGVGPELTAVREYWEANGVEHQPPVCHGQAAVGVA